MFERYFCFCFDSLREAKLKGFDPIFGNKKSLLSPAQAASEAKQVQFRHRAAWEMMPANNGDC